MSGLIALLDDIATLAKLTMSTVDDTAAMAVKTSAKVSAAAVDDIAATPQYVTGISPERELPVIRQIAIGSLRNKLLIILPAGLMATWLAPWLLPIALVLGGSYLCLEAGEKLAEKFGSRLRPPHAASQSGGVEAVDVPSEDGIVSQATRTDFVLSTEIMLLALAEVHASSLQRVLVLVAVALLITFGVYGLVALLIKIDDAGAHLAHNSPTDGGRRLGRAVVHAAPGIFRGIGIIGTVAMCWVGGEILSHNLAELGWHPLAHLIERAQQVGAQADAGAAWLAGTGAACLIGALVGLVLTGLAWSVRRVIAVVRGGKQ